MALLLAVKDGQELFTVDEVTEEWKPATPERRFLHISPKLYLTAEELHYLGRRKARLSVSSSALGQSVSPGFSGVQVRRPFPNKRYLVGGSRYTHKGWLIELPPELVIVDLQFRWEIPLVAGDDPMARVAHDVLLTLEESAPVEHAQCFTMEVWAWPDRQMRGGAPVDFKPYAVLGSNIHNERTRWVEVLEPGNGVDVHLTEDLSIPAVSLERVWGFRLLSQRVECDHTGAA